MFLSANVKQFIVYIDTDKISILYRDTWAHFETVIIVTISL